VVEDHLNGVQGKIFSFEGEGFREPPRKQVRNERRERTRPLKKKTHRIQDKPRAHQEESEPETIPELEPLEVPPEPKIEWGGEEVQFEYEPDETPQEHEMVKELKVEWATTDDDGEEEDIPRLLELGRELSNKGSFLDAQACFDRILAKDDRNHEAWNERGVALWNQGDPGKALESYEKALELEPDSLEAWINKGVAWSSMGEKDDALSCYDRALEISQESTEAWSNKGVTLFQLKRYREAERCFSQLTRFEPRDPNAWIYRGFALERMGDDPNARRCYEMVIELDPHHQEAIKSLESLKVEKWD